MSDDNSSDVLGRILQDFRFTGVAYGQCEMRRPWSISFVPEGTARLHLVIEGDAWLKSSDGAWEQLVEGDVALLVRGPSHVLADRPDRTPVPIEELGGREVARNVFHIDVAGRGRRTIMTCCSVAYDGPALRSLTALMPEQIILRSNDQQAVDPLLATLLAAMADEVRDQRAGGATMLTRLADLIIGRIIRSWAETSSVNPAGWLAAVNDRRLGKALLAMHERPGVAWNATSLAGEAGMSKSAFYERFTTTIGQTPARYLATVRMSAALDMLRSGRTNVATAANELGYESEASFSRAFKRVVGKTPSMARPN